MLNIGLIGKISSIDQQIVALNKYPDIMIQGKSSVGIKTQASDFGYSIPEYNRIELIERVDAIFIDDASLIPYTLLRDTIKRGKHFFFAGLPNFTTEQCAELSKIIDEAGTVVQVKNPLFFNTPIQFIAAETTSPAYFEFEACTKNKSAENFNLTEVFMLALKISGRAPKKIRQLYCGGSEDIFTFHNIRIEFADSSLFTLNIYTSCENEKTELKAISENNLFEYNFLAGTLKTKGAAANVKIQGTAKEYESFFKSVIKRQPPVTGINDYLTALKIADGIKGNLNVLTL